MLPEEDAFPPLGFAVEPELTPPVAELELKEPGVNAGGLAPPPTGAPPKHEVPVSIASIAIDTVVMKTVAIVVLVIFKALLPYAAYTSLILIILDAKSGKEDSGIKEFSW